MKTYKCHDCGESYVSLSMWVWEDDKLRCSPCTNKRLDRMTECMKKQSPDAMNTEARATGFDL